MSNVLAPSPVFQGTNQNGQVLSGGLLYTYAAGTTTPIATFQNAFGTLNTNPVVLNSMGEALVWLTNGQAYKFNLTDSAGNQIPGYPVDNINGQGGIVATANFPITPQEIAAGVTPTNTLYQPGVLLRYGNGSNTGLGDNIAAFTAAIAQAAQGGAAVTLPAGTYNVNSVNLPIVLPANITITGAGKNSTNIVVTGANGGTIFTTTDTIGSIEIAYLQATGNSVSNTGADGNFFWATMDGSATANMDSFRIHDCSFTNFGGDYWLYFQNLGNTFQMRKIQIHDNSFTSKIGNARGPNIITIESAMVGLYGSITGAGGFISDIDIHDNLADGTYVKTFCVVWSSVFRARVHDNILRNFGTGSVFTTPDVARYALICYNFSHLPGFLSDEIDFSDNMIDMVGDVGIYIAGVGRMACNNNMIRGQSTNADNLLPKGCIASAGANYLVLNGNSFYDSVLGCELTVAVGNFVKMTDTFISNITAGCVKLSAVGTGSVGSIEIDGLTIENQNNLTVGGVLVTGTSTIALGNLKIANARINNPFQGISLFSVDSTVVALGTVTLTNIEITDTRGIGLSWSAASNPNTRTVIDGVSFQAPNSGAELLVLNGSTNLTVRNITFEDLTGATFCWYGSGAQGVVSNVNFVNIPSGLRFSTSADLGVQLPTWTGNPTDFVQNLNPIEQGTTGVKYVTMGWVFDFTSGWKQCRTTTGN